MFEQADGAAEQNGAEGEDYWGNSGPSVPRRRASISLDGAAGQDAPEGEDYWGRPKGFRTLFRKRRFPFRMGSIPFSMNGAAGQDGAEGEDYWSQRWLDWWAPLRMGSIQLDGAAGQNGAEGEDYSGPFRKGSIPLRKDGAEGEDYFRKIWGRGWGK